MLSFPSYASHRRRNSLTRVSIHEDGLGSTPVSPPPFFLDEKDREKKKKKKKDKDRDKEDDSPGSKKKKKHRDPEKEADREKRKQEKKKLAERALQKMVSSF
jgi:nucleosome binding factor SPN SPT16 subunit